MDFVKINRIKKWIISLIFIAAIQTTANATSITLMGDSWLAGTYNPLALHDINQYTGIPSGNYALNSMHTKDLLWHIQTLYANGLNLGSNAIVIIDIGLPDFLDTPVTSRQTTKDNLFKIVDIFAAHGVKVILSGAPEVYFVNEVNAGHLHIDPIYAAVKARQPQWVQILDLQSKLMMIPQFGVAIGDHVHLNADGYTIFNLALANAARELNQQSAVIISDADAANWLAAKGLSQEDGCTVQKLIKHYNAKC